MMKKSALASLCIAGLMPAPALAQPMLAVEIPIATDGPIAPVTTRHVLASPKGSLLYSATWSEIALKDEAGLGRATISATAYVRDDVTEPAARPVVIFFNGGPGASSSPLHFGGFGPRRLGERDPSGKRAVVDNPATLLDTADLVFVDPVGTGFSRPLKPGGGAAYWSVGGDAQAVLGLVREWLRTNRRTASPLFLVGESYGGYRLATMAKAMRDLNVAGLVLISPALDFGTSADQGAIDSLPTMAVAAWQHRRRRDGRSVEQVWEEARRFAQSEYAVALQQGSAIAPAERARIAARLAALTGMSQSVVEQANLRIDSQLFLESLVPGQVVGRLDVRVSAPKPDKPLNANRPAAANDPALGLGKTNVILSQPIGDYLRSELKVPTTRDYYSLSLDVNFSWSWKRSDDRPGAGWNTATNIAELMRAKPDLRLLLLGGYYDLTVPLLSPRYVVTHSGIPLGRTKMVALPAGHSVFEGEGLPRASALLHDFVAGRE
jgi:carboxypeptidase C (cathepsin A)